MAFGLHCTSLAYMRYIIYNEPPPSIGGKLDQRLYFLQRLHSFRYTGDGKLCSQSVISSSGSCCFRALVDLLHRCRRPSRDLAGPPPPTRVIGGIVPD